MKRKWHEQLWFYPPLSLLLYFISTAGIKVKRERKKPDKTADLTQSNSTKFTKVQRHSQDSTVLVKEII